jgi:hypothetical protein
MPEKVSQKDSFWFPSKEKVVVFLPLLFLAGIIFLLMLIMRGPCTGLPCQIYGLVFMFSIIFITPFLLFGLLGFLFEVLYIYFIACCLTYLDKEYKKPISVAAMIFLLIILVVQISLPDAPSQLYCSSSAPSKILLKAWQIDSAGGSGTQLGGIRLVQITGSDISNVSCIGAGAFAESVSGCLDTIAHGKDFELKPNASKAGSYDKGTIAIEYTDSDGAEKSAVITCQGAITVS